MCVRNMQLKSYGAVWSAGESSGSPRGGQGFPVRDPPAVLDAGRIPSARCLLFPLPAAALRSLAAETGRHLSVASSAPTGGSARRTVRAAAVAVVGTSAPSGTGCQCRAVLAGVGVRRPAPSFLAAAAAGVAVPVAALLASVTAIWSSTSAGTSPTRGAAAGAPAAPSAAACLRTCPRRAVRRWTSLRPPHFRCESALAVRGAAAAWGQALVRPA